MSKSLWRSPFSTLAPMMVAINENKINLIEISCTYNPLTFLHVYGNKQSLILSALVNTLTKIGIFILPFIILTISLHTMNLYFLLLVIVLVN